MTKSIFKSIAIGALIGLAIFMMPMFLIGIFIIVSLIRLVAGRGMHRGYHSFAYADNIRSMSEEEYNQYKAKAQAAHMHCHHHHFTKEPTK